MKRWVERTMIAGRFCTLHFTRLEDGYGQVQVHGPRGLLADVSGTLAIAERGARAMAEERLSKGAALRRLRHPSIWKDYDAALAKARP